MPDGSITSYEKVQDYQVYWMASCYVAAERVPRAVLAALRDHKALRAKYESDPASRELSDAMNPLLNDISDRERAGEIGDFLFAVEEDERKTWAVIDMPPSVSWTTEGLTTTASPPAPLPPQTVRVRRFWYVHRNGAVSWHVAFLLDYGPEQSARDSLKLERLLGIQKEDRWHRPALLYFLSRLQKVLAPKEFAPGATLAPGVRVHRKGPTGVALLDTTMITIVNEDGSVRPPQPSPPPQERQEEAAVFTASAGDPNRMPFWQQMGLWFARDVGHFFERVEPGWAEKLKAADAGRAGRMAADPFEELVGAEPFLEIPGLRMPRFRYMFFFVDETFFNRLLPPVEPGGRKLLPRAQFVHENCYLPYLQKNQELTAGDQLNLDARFWSWVEKRDDFPGQLKFVKAELKKRKKSFDEWYAAYRADKPAWKDDSRPDCLDYLFLSGFNQNIIDFMAQDASEILDSLDPIYPDADDESGERFFVRYATPRSFITYVRTSRSLEAGNDHFGMCPYAFLIHALALHNEYLARDYEVVAERLIAEIEQDIETSETHAPQPGRAIQRFSRFRTGPFSDYARARYGKVFRYDTEAKVFEEMQQRRGIERKTEYLEVIVENLEKQTEELQGRLQKREDREVTYALGAVGVFGLGSLLLDLIGGAKEYGHVEAPGWLFWLIAAGAMALVIGILAVLVIYGARDINDGFEQRERDEEQRAWRNAEWGAPKVEAPRRSLWRHVGQAVARRFATRPSDL